MITVMIVIQEDVAARMQNRLNQLWSIVGKKKSAVDSLDDFINKILTNYLDKKDKEALTNINHGMTWKQFRNRHFNEVYIRDKGYCKYCPKRLSRAQATLDHIIPPSRGGLNTLENVTVACDWCNGDKGILTDEEYYYKQLVNAAKGIRPPK